MPDLAVLKVDPRFLAIRPSEFDHRSRAAHALELNDVSKLQIAKRSLKFFRGCFRRRTHQALYQVHKIPMRDRFLEKMNRAESGGLFALLRPMHAGQDNRARVRVTRSQIVKEILTEVRDSIDIEHKKLRFYAKNNLLRFFQAPRHFYQR